MVMAKSKTAQIEQKLEALQAQMSQVQLLLNAVGINGPWVTLQVASAALALPVSRLRDECDRAEDKRAKKEKCDLIYGTHYRIDNDPHDPEPPQRRTFKVHLQNFQRVILKPANERY
jgi:hypothetical protein